MFVQGSGSTPVKTGSSPPSTNSFDMMSPRSGVDSNISLKSELSDLDSPDVTSKPEKKPHRTSTADKEQVTDNINVTESSTATSKCFWRVSLYCIWFSISSTLSLPDA